MEFIFLYNRLGPDRCAWKWEVVSRLEGTIHANDRLSESRFFDDVDLDFTTASVDALFLQVFSDTSNGTSIIEASYSLICLFAEAHSGSLFSATDSFISSFIAQSVLSLLHRSLHGASSAISERLVCVVAVSSPFRF